MHASPSDTSASRRKARRPWANLQPDLLQDISGRLPDVRDHVRFHAVCRPRRRTSPVPLFRVASALCDGLILHSTINHPRFTISPVRSVANYSRDYASFARFTGKRNWVASADGTAAWFFRVSSPEPTLLDLLTGEVMSLPRLPDDEATRLLEHSRGIVYGDGTIFLYSFTPDPWSYKSTFTAAVLCPGDTAWTVMRRKNLHVLGRSTGATYHDGKVTVFVDVYRYIWRVLTPDHDEDDDEGGRLDMWLGDEREHFHDSYVLESHGELLWVTIFVDKKWRHVDDDRDQTQAVSLAVHTLEGSKEDGDLRWVPSDGRSLSDRVFFLGSPASFAVDAAYPGANGGCVYFVFDQCVLRYSLVSNEATLVEKLRPGWGFYSAHVWLRY